jgi:protocadherin-15
MTFKFYVEVRDNVGNPEGPIHKTRARVVVNLLSDANRMSLVFETASPREIRRYEKALEELLYEKSDGLLVGIEKYSTRKMLPQNGTLREVAKATDLWFYVIDPTSETILDRNSSLVTYNLLVPKVQNEITYSASSIAKANALGIYEPVGVRESDQDKKIRTAIVINEDNMPYILTLVAIIVLILGVIGIVYICVTWSR